MNRLYSSIPAAEFDALRQILLVADKTDDLATKAQVTSAMSATAHFLAKDNAGRGLSGAVGHAISDLFGGADPRKVAEALRGALAAYGIGCGLGPGADIARSLLAQSLPNDS